MENRRIVKFVLICFVVIFIFPFFVFAYDDKTTHPALTDEIVDLFNYYYPDFQIPEQEKDSIKKGSVEEDAIPRWMQHFFDPVYNRGLVLGAEWEKSKDWAKDTLAQAKYDPVYTASLGTITRKLFNSKTDYSWDRAVYEYVWGDKRKGLEALGHILHLLEDATVPEHTRNDVHLPFLNQESFYEDWASQFTDKSFSLTNKLINKNEKPLIFSDLNQYFDNNAVYSNNNFFSRDTIFIKDYTLPVIISNKEEKLSDGQIYEFGYAKVDNKNYKLVLLGKRRLGSSEVANSVYDPDYLILTDYWNLLSEEAVLSGAGVIKLFFDEVEKEKNSKILLSKNTSFFGKMLAAIGNIFSSEPYLRTSQDPSSATLNVAPAPSTSQDPSSATLNVAPAPSTSQAVGREDESDSTSYVESIESDTTIPGVAGTRPPPAEVGPPRNDDEPKPEITEHSVSNKPPPPFVPSLPYPGFGGGGVPSPSPQTGNPEEQANGAGGFPANEQNEEQTPPSPPPSSPPEQPSPDTTSPNPPVIVSPSDFSSAFMSSAIIFSGTAEASSTVSNDFNNATTTADSNGNWSLGFSFNQGTTTINFFAADPVGNISSSTEVSLFVDSIGPTLDSFSISECSSCAEGFGGQGSFSQEGCLLTSTTLHLLWQSSAEDLDYFELSVNGSISATTSTSTAISVSDNSANNFSLRAKDISGNWSTVSTTTVEISSMPVVINEIAWAGTGPQTSADEWIELYNRTNRDIDLSGWELKSSDAGPDIVFGEDSENRTTVNKIIPAKGYYLIERTKDDAVNDIPADWYGSFTNGLSNRGEILILSRASAIIDQTPLCGSGYVQWCPGFDYEYRTMERIDSDISGTEPTNWEANNMIIRNGKNNKDEDISGTPKARNSVSYLINKGNSSIAFDLVLTKSKSPYFVNNTVITIQPGFTLTIEPGVVIKFYNSAGMNVLGKLIARGAAEEPIVFTSFYDDEYAGDTNQDATTTLPHSGNWYGISISSSGSILDRAIFRYAGKWYNGAGNSMANLFVQGASATITNSIFEYSEVYGLSLINSSSAVSNNIFRFNNRGPDPAGSNSALLVFGGSPIISNNAFRDNKVGLTLYDSSVAVSGNHFESNSFAAINSFGAFGSFTNNSGSSNGINGIVVSGNLTRQNETAILRTNSLAYVLGGSANVVSNSTLVVESGVVVKAGGSQGGSLGVNGNLVLQGSNSGDIIFTSFSANPQPGNWQGISINPGGASDIKGVTFSYADKAISYYNSPIKLENVKFENNNLAVYADGAAVGQTVFAGQPITALLIEFLNNLATTSPAGLW